MFVCACCLCFVYRLADIYLTRVARQYMLHTKNSPCIWVGYRTWTCLGDSQQDFVVGVIARAILWGGRYVWQNAVSHTRRNRTEAGSFIKCPRSLFGALWMNQHQRSERNAHSDFTTKTHILHVRTGINSHTWFNYNCIPYVHVHACGFMAVARRIRRSRVFTDSEMRAKI